jgi:primosomal protein N'
MAKEKIRKSIGVKKVEDKYVCEECLTEIPVMQSCPNCKKEIDWERALQGMRRYQ